MNNRRKAAAIRRRRLFICFCSVFVAILLFLTGIMISYIKTAIQNDAEEDGSSDTSASENTGETPNENENGSGSGDIPDNGNSGNDNGNNGNNGNKGDNGGNNGESTDYDKPQPVVRGDTELDANYSRLLLVNAEYPLPEDYKYGWNVTEFDVSYSNNSDKLMHRIDTGIWPYVKAMIDAARKDGIDLSVWSPYRTYEMQERLFKNRVAKEGGDEAKAATAVARPGTSEHNTGLCADFNMASSKFESTKTFTWMCEHAEEYGFILRYPKDKIDITGVMYESWHWRFVGINRAKEINNLNVTLEEYIKLKGLDPQAELYKE
ncbi:MAG: M15 family metallopeptidase [Clostridia bacterium]|nr:M15 family metallopeptidase [Clostridia bacterium]